MFMHVGDIAGRPVIRLCASNESKNTIQKIREEEEMSGTSGFSPLQSISCLAGRYLGSFSPVYSGPH